jgi:hypothetical protein
MKITKRQLRRIIKEACGLDQAPVAKLPEIIPADDAVIADPDVPSPQDYEIARQTLDQSPELVDMGISMVMDLAGTSCERSTAQAIIDHLQEMLDGVEDDFSFTGDVGELSGDEAFGIGYEAGQRGL